MSPLQITHILHALGHAPEFSRDAEYYAWVLSDAGRNLIRRYQKWHRLPETGVPWDAAVHLSRRRCAHPDVMALGAESKWGIPAITYYQNIAYPDVDPIELAADYALAVQRVTAVCGIQVTPAASPELAQVVAKPGPIDGEWSVLALSELPPPGAGMGTVLHQTFDFAEVGLTRPQRQAMMAHEFCHCLGLGHAQPGSGNLMEPVLSSFNAPQAWDTAQLQERYGVPGTPTPTPTPPPMPPPSLGIYPTTSLVNTTKPEAQYTITLDEPGRYLIVVVPMPKQ